MSEHVTQYEMIKEKVGALEKRVDKSEIKLDDHVKTHEKAHQRVEEEIYKHGKKLERHETMIPELKETMQRMGDSVDKLVDAVGILSVTVTRLDEQTLANTNGRKTAGDWTKEILIGILLLTLGFVLNGGG